MIVIQDVELIHGPLLSILCLCLCRCFPFAFMLSLTTFNCSHPVTGLEPPASTKRSFLSPPVCCSNICMVFVMDGMEVRFYRVALR